MLIGLEVVTVLLPSCAQNIIVACLDHGNKTLVLIH